MSNSRSAYLAAYHKHRYANDPARRSALLRRSAEWRSARKTKETPEQKRERIAREKFQRVMRETPEHDERRKLFRHARDEARERGVTRDDVLAEWGWTPSSENFNPDGGSTNR